MTWTDASSRSAVVNTVTSRYQELKRSLKANPATWLVTGVAGFIGSNLLETLLKLEQRVVGLDNFVTGFKHNLAEVQVEVEPEQWDSFTFIEGDIRDLDTCQKACREVDYVLHQAALGSVPRSLEDPITTNQANIDGFLNMLVAARDSKVRRFVYAASSSTYGDHPDLPKVEDKIGRPLSPYAVTKLVNELYADVFARAYGLSVIGLRYFNVFGRRQDPDGAYAAVIPKWIAAMIHSDTVYINGDGETSRDFCYIENAIQANLLAACTEKRSMSSVYNISYGERTDLNGLFELIRDALEDVGIRYEAKPRYAVFRKGDIQHSMADIGKAQDFLGYEPKFNVTKGLAVCVDWYVKAHQS